MKNTLNEKLLSLVTFAEKLLANSALIDSTSEVKAQMTLNVSSKANRCQIEIVADDQLLAGYRTLFVGYGSTEDEAIDKIVGQFRTRCGSAAKFRRLMQSV
jgi:hypothetical protein